MGYDSANIIVTSAAGIPVPAKASQYNYVHTRIAFKDIDILDADTVPVESDVSAMQKMFDGRTAVIYMELIGADVSTSVNTSSFSIMSEASEKDIGKMPTGMKTTDGSIIPHPLLPDKNFDYADNGIYFNNDTSDLPKSGGYLWIPTSLAGSDDVKENDPEVDDAVKKLSTYGHRDYNMYVRNHDAQCAVDIPIMTKRKYHCTTEATTFAVGTGGDTFAAASAGKGAFALCYYIEQCETITKETEDARGRKNLVQPFVKFDIGARKRRDSATVDDTENNTAVDNDTQKVAVTIRTGGEAEIRAGVDAQAGSFCPLQNDMTPPQYVKDAEGMTRMQVIYMYPTYYGLVARNSISSDPKKQQVSEVVLKDSLNGVKSPWNNLTVIDADGSAIYTQYAKDYLKNNPGSDLEFFPTTLHEATDYTQVALKVNDGDSIRFNRKINLTWSRCVGRWAYCPLYFHRNLKFTLYFKGAYKNAEGQSSSFDYRLYPLVGIDSEASASSWAIGVSNGAGTSLPATVVCTDDDKLETIYKAVFQFKSNQMQRLPVEVFGAELVLRRKEFQFTHKSGNGSFKLCRTSSGAEGSGASIREQYGYARTLQGSTDKFLSLITSLSLTTNMDGVSGSMELDGYPIEQGIGVLQQTQSVGEVDLGIKLGTSGTVHHLFSGYGFEIATTGSDSDYRMSVKLEGVQKKMNDMKLVCAPFWDGDRLEAICNYFEQYLNLKLKMIDHTVNSHGEAKTIDTNLFTHSGNWESEDAYTLLESGEESETGINDNAFRVPRSFNWMSPAVNFQTGTPCLEALKKLAEFTSCVFCVGSDGVGYFYELDKYGFPYYVQNQIDNGNYVTFALQEIVSINLSPSFENWYNSIATFGFIRKTTKEAALDPASKDAVMPGVNYTITDSTLFPWSRHNVGVENGFLTKKQLRKVHNTRVRFAKSRRSVGTVTVLGNTSVSHMYQVIKIAGVFYYVLQISHSIDTGRKMWTTSYQIGYFQPGTDSDSSSSGF